LEKEFLFGKFCDRGDENPSKIDIVKTHTTPIALKRKIYVIQKERRKFQYLNLNIWKWMLK
jgi:hypothetical protein